MIRFFQRSSPYRDVIFSIGSVVLLVLAFPKTNWYGLSFIALIPWLFALEGKNKRQAFKLSYKVGWLFFICVLYWITLVPPEILTFFGLFLLVAYLALFFGFFGIIVSIVSRKNILTQLIVLPSAWCLLEYVRGHFLTGFGWASLCHSQTSNLPLIQIADITGMLGVSFFIVLINVFLKEFFRTIFLSPQETGRQWKLAVILVLSVGCVVGGYGFYRLNTEEKAWTRGMDIAVIQGNITQDNKLNQLMWESNYKQYVKWTRIAAQQNPDLIIWPETALPGYINIDDSFLIQVREFVKEIQVPVLLGTVENDGDDYYNIALLITKDGDIVEKYRKMHLVPFGEYIPLRKQIPLLSSIIPIGDFSSSDEYTVFNPQASVLKGLSPFAVQICFEDAVPSIARQFVRGGAEFLVNMTNDAWFQDTTAPFLHLQSSVFRAVENRKTVVRAANTGISGFINPLGKVESVVSSEGDLTFVEGIDMQSIFLRPSRSFYSHYGDVFVWGCLVVFLFGLLSACRKEKS